MIQINLTTIVIRASRAAADCSWLTSIHFYFCLSLIVNSNVFIPFRIILNWNTHICLRRLCTLSQTRKTLTTLILYLPEYIHVFNLFKIQTFDNFPNTENKVVREIFAYIMKSIYKEIFLVYEILSPNNLFIINRYNISK